MWQTPWSRLWLCHCHVTGKYRGAADSKCNLKLWLHPKKTKILVVFHNLRGYDSHLLMQAMSKAIAVAEPLHEQEEDDVQALKRYIHAIEDHKLKCIPNNTEKYSFSLGQLRFIDSAQLLLAPLDKLVSSFTGGGTGPLAKTNRWTPHDVQLLAQKDMYPYEYMDSWDRFEEQALPPKERPASSMTRTLAMRTTPMRRRYGRHSGVGPLVTTATSTAGQTHSCLPTSSKPSGRPTWSSTG